MVRPGDKCYRCGRPGHYANACPKNPHAGAAVSRRTSSQRPRNQERRFFDKMTKNVIAAISSASDAEHLLRAALSFKQEEGASGLLYRLADAQTIQAGSLRKSLEYVSEESVFINGFLPLLEILGGDDLGKPVYEKPLESVLLNLYSMQFLLPEILSHVQASRVRNNDHYTAIVWFLAKLALLSGDIGNKVRSDPTVLELSRLLSESGVGTECLETILVGRVESAAYRDLSLAEVRDQQATIPGGRHNNDFADFRSIEIIPTIDEFLCPADPYLPKATSDPMSVADLLDRQFRLMREDILGPSKEEQDDKRKLQRDLFEGVRASHVVTGEPISIQKNGKEFRISGPSDPCICFSFRVPHWHRASRLKTQKEKEEYWDRSRRVLPRDALVCLLRENSERKWAPIRFGTIVRRETMELAVTGKKAKPTIGIAFFKEDDLLESLKELSDSCIPPTRLLVVSAELFAYQPILRGLQMMDSVPFKEEILLGQLPEEQDVQPLNVPKELQSEVDKLDKGQLAALNHALTNRVTLIQGPPGTGKTYIGVLLAQTILASTRETILCVCYTNHALDDFLEGLLDVGIRKIVRIGGRSKNARLAEFNLREKAKGGKTPFNREQTRRFAHLKGTIDDAVKEVNSIKKACSREIGKGWWKRIEPHLQAMHPQAYEQLRIDALEDSNGFKTVGVESEDHLWKLWLLGKPPSKAFEDRKSMQLWTLSKEERNLVKLKWQHEFYEDHRLSLSGSLKTIKNAKDELRQLQDSTDSIILSQARVIACTTTKAAMCKSLLDDASAGVVLVEEAAEIFESHVLTSLSRNTRRLIMIGDHKQLRPKAQHYPLTVESNREYDLNRSLFERLAKVLPTSRLGIQHRMHPTISKIPRITTYPELQDDPSTSNRPSVTGIQSRLVFISHDYSEDSHSTEIERVDAVSKTNRYEVEMVVAVVKYLFQQGYQPKNLVVLTPYLGQLLKIQAALALTWKVLIDDMDFNEARRFLQGVDGFDIAARNGTEDSSVIRVATIDNYQGEEADIVIASLVRGNSEHNIGFLREPERVNVLLSRARMCEVVIGNRRTLEGARGSEVPLRGGQLWKKILQHLDSLGHVYAGLPVICQSHGNKATLRTAEEITMHSPDGGCTEPCTKALDCGHPCTKQCHVGPCVKCIVLCSDKCPRGHTIIRKCSDADNPPKCHFIISWKCPLGHAMSGPCFKGKDSSGCVGCQLIKDKIEEDLRIEKGLQDELDNRHHQLEKSRDKLNEALRSNKHQEQLGMLDDEMALVERQLKEARRDSRNSSTNDAQTGQAFWQDLNSFVFTLLDQCDSKELSAAEIAEIYNERKGYDLQRAANRSIDDKNETQMPYPTLFERLPCCEVVSSKQREKKKRFKQKAIVRLLKNASLATSVTTSDMVDVSQANICGKSSRIDESSDEAAFAKKARIDDYKQKAIVRLLKNASLATSVTTSDMVDVSQANICGKSSRIDESSDEAAFAKKARIDDYILPDVCMEVVPQKLDKDASSPPLKERDPKSATENIAVEKEPAFGEHEEAPFDDAPVHGMDSDDSDVPSAVSDVIKRFVDEGALGADNLLDEIKSEASLRASSEFQSLEYIIGESLDPHGASNLARPPSKPEYESSLCQGVCLYAYSLYCSLNDFPLQAQQTAAKLLSIVDKNGLKIPRDWLKRAKEFSEPTSPTTKGARTRVEDSPVEKWSLVLTHDQKAPAVMADTVLPMIGLNSVKNSMITMYHRIKLAQEQSDGIAASYNIRFEGNPGTGKTTIARHYGCFLQQLSVLPEGSIFKETSGVRLINDGISGLTAILKEIKAAGGGVLFVDEAYQLVTDREGKKVLDFILPLAENLDSEYGPVVWVFAGYKKEMEKLFEYNLGLPSRFPHHFVFEDYNDDELGCIFKDMMTYQQKSASSGTKTKGRTRRPSAYNPSYSPTSYSNGSKMRDRFGRTWTYYQYAGWTDDLGNRSLDPKQLGNAGYELVDPSGTFWEEDGGNWYNLTTGSVQRHYPGEAAPSLTSSRMLRPNPFFCDNEQDLLIAIRRLGRRRGAKGFGNARAVRILFERVRDRQASRVTDEREYGRSPDTFELVRTDLLGPDITPDSLKKSQAWQALEKMEGLLPVKESVGQLFQLVLNNVERERKGLPMYEVALNRLFLGGPGTGKTTVAKVYGAILADLGLLSKGEVIYKCASDFVGDVLGASEKNTKGIIASAEGCVLVIDEAYALYSGGKSPNANNDPYKTSVIDTIVEQVQAKPGADIAVVMLGYQAEMENMLSKVNPGLSRRFQLENAFHFPDFDDSALIRIMMAKAREQKIGLELPVAKRAIRTLAKARAKPNFGNAGAVDNLLSQAISHMQRRKNHGDLVIDDFDYSGDEHDDQSLKTLFNDLIGCSEVLETMDDLRDTVVFSKAQSKPPMSNISFNYIFLGSPGTGKTTVARRMGIMFEALGLLPDNEMKEIKASDLLTGYVGQAGQKTRELLREARGGVLFIDEAYQLDPRRGGSFMTEAVDELVGALTDEEFKGKLLVILAGYDEDMEEMLSVNPGLKSRFSERIHFHDFDANATAELLQMELEKREIPLKIEDLNDLCRHAQRLVDSEGFGNGRDVVTWADRVFKEVAKRYSSMVPVKSSRRSTLSMNSTLKDITVALEHLLSSRKVNTNGPRCSTANPSTLALPTMEDATNAPAPPPPNVAMLQEQETVDDKEVDETSDEAVPDSAFQNIDSGILQGLQNYVEEEGLDSEEGVQRLSSLDPAGAEFATLLERLVKVTGMDPDTALDQLRQWQGAHQDLKKTIEATKSAIVGARPLWRCAVCGRANKPWIACYVAPYIVGYEQIALGDV